MRKISLLIIFTLSVTLFFAAGVSAGEVLTLQKAIEVALDQNPEILSARQEQV